MSDVVFSLAVVRHDGQLAYATNTQIDKISLPNPLPSNGRMRFTFNPVCFHEGSYTLDLSAIGPGSAVYDFHKGLSGFNVRTEAGDSGLARPPHFWRIEALEAPSGSRVAAQPQ
jgi:lipopolysaccharide transport system ATP-binding protein